MQLVGKDTVSGIDGDHLSDHFGIANLFEVTQSSTSDAAKLNPKEATVAFSTVHAIDALPESTPCEEARFNSQEETPRMRGDGEYSRPAVASSSAALKRSDVQAVAAYQQETLDAPQFSTTSKKHPEKKKRRRFESDSSSDEEEATKRLTLHFENKRRQSQ